MTRLFLATFAIFTISAGVFAEEAKAPLSFKMKSLSGDPVNLNDYQGKVVLIVNVASECGLTPQYEQLQSLYEQYSKQGLAVLGFPCNQFGGQEPGSAKEISQFCKENYGVEFDMFEKVDVNGEGACGLYKYLTNHPVNYHAGARVKPDYTGKISWNFEKFLIGRDGQVKARYQPRISPDDEQVVKAIQAELAK